MQQQAANKPGFFDQLLPMLGYLLGSGVFSNSGGPGQTYVDRTVGT
jgi:hypothetical protein